MSLYYEIFDKIFNLEKIDFKFLKNLDEFAVLETNPENQIFHKEKNSAEHIQKVLDNTIEYLNLFNITGKDAIILYMTALFHDFRKPQTLSIDEDGIFHNYEHELQASRYIYDIAYKSTFFDSHDKFEILRLASTLIHWHMAYKSRNLKMNPYIGHLVNCFSFENLRLLSDFAYLDSGEDYQENYDLLLQKKYANPSYYPERDDIEMIVLIGPIGCGKSTFAKQLSKEIDNSIIVSTDNIREELYGNRVIQGSGSVVFGEAYQRIKRLLSFDKKNIIFDATNLNYKLRQNIINIAQQRKISITSYYFLTPLEICLEQNKRRKEPVNENILTHMYGSIEEPSYFESNKIIYKHNFKI